MHNLLLATKTTLCMSPSGNSGVTEKRGVVLSIKSIISTRVSKSPFGELRFTFCKHLHLIQIFLHTLSIWRSMPMLLLQISLPPIFQLFSLQVSSYTDTDHWPKPVNQYIFVHLVMCTSRQYVLQGTLSEILPSVKISLHLCPSGISRIRAIMLRLFTCGWCLHNDQNHL